MSTSDALYDTLAEVLHYIALTGWFPGDILTVSPTMRHVERAALRGGFVTRAAVGWQLSGLGRLWLAQWAEAVAA